MMMHGYAYVLQEECCFAHGVQRCSSEDVLWEMFIETSILISFEIRLDGFTWRWTPHVHRDGRIVFTTTSGLISWGKCVWRLEDCLHNNYIAIEFPSYFLFWVLFLHFLRILIDFYRTTALGCYILHFFSLGLILRTTATSNRVFLCFSHFWVISFLGQIDGVFYMISALQASCPIHWVRIYIYQVRSTSTSTRGLLYK